jgi:hypothetical protein
MPHWRWRQIQPAEEQRFSYRLLPLGLPQCLEGLMVSGMLLDVFSDVVRVRHVACLSDVQISQSSEQSTLGISRPLNVVLASAP